MSETSKVYLISNTHNDKAYVGLTSQKYVSSRWGNHKQRSREGKDTHLYRAMRLYGETAFSWQILGEFPNRSEAQNAEKLWIILLNANHSNFGYNTTRGGEAPKHADETKRKISQIQKENPKPREFYQTIGRMSRTPEHRAAHSARIKQMWADGVYDNRRPKGPTNPEAVNRQRERMKQAWADGTMKGSTGQKASEETKKKRSESLLKYNASLTPEQRKKSPEARKNMSLGWEKWRLNNEK